MRVQGAAPAPPSEAGFASPAPSSGFGPRCASLRGPCMDGHPPQTLLVQRGPPASPTGRCAGTSLACEGAPAARRETGPVLWQMESGRCGGQGSPPTATAETGNPFRGPGGAAGGGSSPVSGYPVGSGWSPCPQAEGVVVGRPGMTAWSAPRCGLTGVPSGPLPDAVAGEAGAPAPVPEPWAPPSSSPQKPAPHLVSASFQDTGPWARGPRSGQRAQVGREGLC